MVKKYLGGEIDPDPDTFEAVTIWWVCYTMVLLYALRLPQFDVDEQVANFERLMEQHFRGVGSRERS